MDNLRFYVLFNSISVISGRCLDDNEKLCANGTPFTTVLGKSLLDNDNDNIFI